MIGRVKTASLNGVNAANVEVEVHLRPGQNRTSIIGLGDSAVREAKDRVLTALRHSGFHVAGELLINLSPAELKKEGSLFDVPIAVAILISCGVIPRQAARGRCFFGELSLDGRIKPVRGTVALTINALERKLTEVVVPLNNAPEADLIAGVNVTAVETLGELAAYLNGSGLPERKSAQKTVPAPAAVNGFDEVWGQQHAKRALSIAAAGGHNVLMIGPPGCGKSMLAERFGGILPPLSESEKLEVIKIHSVAGLPLGRLLLGERPYRSPHHLVSDVGLIGGGVNPKPGEISLAHHGVLFLDELPEFRRAALEALRLPLESGMIQIARAKTSLAFPAEFQLLAAMNPCPCGRLGAGGQACLCSRPAIASYLKKLSQPILDRIDLHIELAAVPVEVLASSNSNEKASPRVNFTELVTGARERQQQRQGKLNSRLSGEELTKYFKISSGARALLEKVIRQSGFSARAYVRILRVAVTLSDIAEADSILEEHIAEAAGFRSLERIQKYCIAA